MLDFLPNTLPIRPEKNASSAECKKQVEGLEGAISSHPHPKKTLFHSLQTKPAMPTLTPERGINLVCLAITAASPGLAIGWEIGLPTGAAAALGLLAVMQGQQSPNSQERRQAYAGAWIVRGFVICFEQMAYQDRFDGRASLPFGWSPIFWAWASVVFMAVLDLWAYYRTATKAAAEAEAAEIAASVKRMEEKEAAERAEREAREAAERQARADREERDRQERLELARIKAEADKAAKIAHEETARKVAEEQRKADGMKVELERIRVETEWKNAEAKRKAEEDARNAAEQRRKEEEVERKAAEAERKAEEAARKAEEARIKRESDAKEKEVQRKAEEEKEALRAKWRAQKAKHHNGSQPETETAVQAEA